MAEEHFGDPVVASGFIGADDRKKYFFHRNDLAAHELRHAARRRESRVEIEPSLKGPPAQHVGTHSRSTDSQYI